MLHGTLDVRGPTSMEAWRWLMRIEDYTGKYLCTPSILEHGSLSELRLSS